MFSIGNPPRRIMTIIDGFGEPTYAWPKVMPNGHKKWLMGWQELGITATWEEYPTGTSKLGTCCVKLSEAIWQGNEDAFYQIFDVDRAWSGVAAAAS